MLDQLGETIIYYGIDSIVIKIETQFVGTKMIYINTWFRPVELTFVTPKYRVAEPSIRCSPFGIKWKILDHPFDYWNFELN